VAIAAGKELTAEFCIEELRIAKYPAADNFERMESCARGKPAQILSLTDLRTFDHVAAVRQHYYNFWPLTSEGLSIFARR
jgi:hypothetical protein